MFAFPSSSVRRRQLSARRCGCEISSSRTISLDHYRIRVNLRVTVAQHQLNKICLCVNTACDDSYL